MLKFIKSKNKSETAILSQNIKTSQNLLIVGSSGSGKTRYVVQPNVLQAQDSLVIVDYLGEMLENHGMTLLKHGYKIKVLNVLDPLKSDTYNPFRYLYNDSDMQNLSNAIVNGSENINLKGSDSHADQILLYQLIRYISKNKGVSRDQKNLVFLIQLLKMDFLELDSLILNSFEKTDDYSNLSQEKKQHAILTCLKRLALRDHCNLYNPLLTNDSLELESICRQKTALFILLPCGWDELPLINALITQLLGILQYTSENRPDEIKLKTQIFLDEFANYGEITNLFNFISHVPSNICQIHLFLQNIQQYNDTYIDKLEHCISDYMFLGGSSKASIKFIAGKINAFMWI